MAKKTFRVQAEVISYCYIDVKANNAEEANEIAYNTEAGDFISEENGGEFNILKTLTEVKKKK